MSDAPEPQLPATFTEGNHNPRLSRTDCHMLFTAIKNHWEIPPAIFKAIPAVLAKLIDDPAVDPRSKTQAVRNFIEMSKQNRETAQALGVIGGGPADGPGHGQDNTLNVKITVINTREEALAAMAEKKARKIQSEQAAPALAPPPAAALPDMADGI